MNDQPVVRPPCPGELVTAATVDITVALRRQLRKHGPGVYAGPHETLGIVTEEVDELRIAVRENKTWEVYDELCDVAVACLFGMASLRVTHAETMRLKDAVETTKRQEEACAA